MTLSAFPTFLTFLTFGLVRAGWLKLVTTKRDGTRYPSVACQPAAFLRGTYVRKVGKVRKGGVSCREDLSDLSDPSDTEALRFPGTWERFPAGPGAPRKPWAADRDPADEKLPR
jgi:hypothetical protein